MRGAIADAVTALVRAVLVAKGKLLFGGHATVTPLVLMVASELDIKGAVDVFQSRWFEEQITRETLAQEDAGFGSIHWVPKGPTQEPSLWAMREAMLGPHLSSLSGLFSNLLVSATRRSPTARRVPFRDETTPCRQAD